MELILEEINIMDECLRPAGDRAAAVVISKSLAHFGTPDNWEILANDYIDELSVIPPDLLNEIWLHVRRECKFFPKIPDMIGCVIDKISARKIKKMKLEVMLSYARNQ